MVLIKVPYSVKKNFSNSLVDHIKVFTSVGYFFCRLFSLNPPVFESPYDGKCYEVSIRNAFLPHFRKDFRDNRNANAYYWTGLMLAGYYWNLFKECLMGFFQKHYTPRTFNLEAILIVIRGIYPYVKIERILKQNYMQKYLVYYRGKKFTISRITGRSPKILVVYGGKELSFKKGRRHDVVSYILSLMGKPPWISSRHLPRSSENTKNI